jgi:hypothetical protein
MLVDDVWPVTANCDVLDAPEHFEKVGIGRHRRTVLRRNLVGTRHVNGSTWRPRVWAPCRIAGENAEEVEGATLTPR